MLNEANITNTENPTAEKLHSAIVLGEPMHALPEDLYIPPNALKVMLESFSGPLDLLLYLIKKQNINILDIPIAQITAQYIEYINLMKQMHLELAAEYLVMAAMLAEIKSRLLLPRPKTADNIEDDPRAELIRRLQEYERYKKAAENLDFIPRFHRDIFPASLDIPEIKRIKQLPTIQLQDLGLAINDILKRVTLYTHHHVALENLSVHDRMAHVLTKLQQSKFLNFLDLFHIKEGRLGVVITFVAILELLKQLEIEAIQIEPFGPIHLRTAEKGNP